ncbi:MAG: MBL fold metallo-hydrolase [Methanomicrobiales archaeon]|nr:MBL fold metallo-hydrolase [Methanomicrobiales archaeon]
MLALTVLMDNTVLTDRFYLAESGFSLYLDADGTRILFDCGYSGAYLANAARMQIDLRNLDHIVLSHGHLDHTGGLYEYLRMLEEARREGIPHRAPTLVAHPWCFCPRTKELGQNIGSPLRTDTLASYLPLTLSDQPVFLSDRLIFLGEIPRIHPFEDTPLTGRQIHLPDGRVEEDRLRDDTALAYLSSQGLVILTGCAHSGICNIISRAQQVSGEDRIHDILGGLHLIRSDPVRIEGTMSFLQEHGVERLHPCHCTSFAARCALAQQFIVEETGVGLRLAS